MIARRSTQRVKSDIHFHPHEYRALVRTILSLSTELLLITCGILATACGSDGRPDSDAVTLQFDIPEGLDTTMAAQLTERHETDNFVFHYRPGDSVLAERQEAFHNWAVDYLGISLPKKIDYYKFAFGDMRSAVGMTASGSGFPRDYALASIHSWHPHETMHLYTYSLCQRATIRLYDEGMAVAHEVDPLNGGWVPQRNHYYGRGDYVYAERVLEHRRKRMLYPIETILESSDFDDARQNALGTHSARVLYDQAGMFVSYLISTFGIDRMKQAVCSVSEGDTRATILREFKEVFGISVWDAERAWWAYLDASM